MVINGKSKSKTNTFALKVYANMTQKGSLYRNFTMLKNDMPFWHLLVALMLAR